MTTTTSTLPANKVEAFLLAAELLDVAEITWWLSDGAALGCVREGKFLRSDHDIDLGCWAGDLPNVRDVLTGQGFGKLRRDMPGQVQIRRPGIKLDIHGHSRHGDVVEYPLGGNAEYRYRFPARLFDQFEVREFYGWHVRVPCPSDDYLTAHYGDDWRTPNPVWRWNASPPCLVKL